MKAKKIMAVLSVTTALLFLTGCNIMNSWRLNVEKGDKYNFHEVVDQDAALIIDELEDHAITVKDMNLTMEIQDVDKDKNVTIAYKYDSIKVSTGNSEKMREYDSKKPDPSDSLADIYGGVVGKGFTVKVSNKGQVLEIKGANELVSSLIGKVPPANQTNPLKGAIKQSFGEDAVKSMVNQSMNYNPSNKVKTNDTWESKYSIAALCPMESNNKFKFLGEKDGLLNVDVQSTVAADTKGKQVQFMEFKSDVKLKGNGKGTININKKTGLIEKGDFKENMSGDMEFTLGSKSKRWPVEISQKITYETTKK
ncbi:hypothetical protein HBE96_16560 [Clostridium sp. P21]|uniref:Lipoprotein n=1 Tax=Clostridium muellerianum TaxID=2716538 RepID=A0A7Y0EIT0_9CLOT|nr:DUF6263 family protein [Clostridium muellerianum]NMM64239.1 hypothetical protein [Clostridium muellerianum]